MESVFKIIEEMTGITPELIAKAIFAIPLLTLIFKAIILE